MDRALASSCEHMSQEKKVALCAQSHKGGAAHPFRVAQRELTKIKGAMPNPQCCSLDKNHNKLSFRGIIRNVGVIMFIVFYHFKNILWIGVAGFDNVSVWPKYLWPKHHSGQSVIQPFCWIGHI